MLCHQIKLQVVLHLLDVSVPLKPRCVGGLKGSRTAGEVGQIIFHESMCTNAVAWRRKGFTLGDHKLTMCSWIDNIYVFSNNLRHALEVCFEFERHVSNKWQLQIKPSSKCCLVARGNIDTPPDGCGYELLKTMPILGHLVQVHGGIGEDWAKTIAFLCGDVFGQALARNVPSI